ncbi:MAG: hypothetical protein JSR90_03020 [Proteobacteria bacterium]|nr:hypothetical protein [Pseudomonadota bacterium]
MIRRRLASDDATIRQLNDHAFGSASESGLIEALRAAGGWLAVTCRGT